MKKILLLLAFLPFLFVSCTKDDATEQLSPSNPNALSSVLVIPNAEVVNSPDLPPSSPSTVAPVVTNIDNNISYSSGGQIIIPSNVSSPAHSNIKGVYIQVKGASTYFDIPINSSSSASLISLPIDLPSLVGPGNFTLIIKFYDNAGNISAVYEVNITVTEASNCGTTRVSGGQGLTSNIFRLGGKAGMVKISYDTYTVPDKIDIFQGGQWIGGTGPSTQRSTLRRALNCNVATESLGYVGKKSEFIFAYNPGLGNEIEVVVSGCENGGTAWQYTFSCPEEFKLGEGSFTTGGQTYKGMCMSTPGYDCSDKVNVVITAQGADSFIIYNMPSASSGTFTIKDYLDYDNPIGDCDLWAAGYLSSGTVPLEGDTTLKGTLTKTGPKSFTFSGNYIDDNHGSHSVSGSGSY